MIKYPPEIRAEVLINHLSSTDSEKITNKVFYQGVFKRNYLNDILRVEQKEYVSNQFENLFYINRDGFYDRLPEGLFHTNDRFKNLSSNNNGNLFSDECEKQKKEIEHSRKFFFPFENEMFTINMKIDGVLNKWLDNPVKYLFNLFINNPETLNISEQHKKRIIPFLPSFSGIRGNIQKLAFFLSAVLQSDVNIEQREGICTMPIKIQEMNNIIGKAFLNNDFVCGEEYSDLCIQWEINIKVSNEVLSDYIEKTHMNSLFEFVSSFFIPVGIEVFFQLQVNQMYDFQLSSCDTMNLEKKQYLGFNIVI